MDFIKIGTLHISYHLLALIISCVVGIICVKVITRQKEQVTILLDTLFWGILFWKGSFILLHPVLFLESPMSLLYFTGGEFGLILAVYVSIVYYWFTSKKKGASISIILQTITTFSLLVFSTYQALSLLWGNPDVMEHLLRSVTPAFALIILFLRRVQIKGGSYVLTLLLFSLYQLFLTIIFGQFSMMDWFFVSTIPVLLTIQYVLCKREFKNLVILIIFSSLIGWTISDFIGEKLKDNEIKTSGHPIATEEGIEVGMVAPDFELENLNGEKVKLSNYRGQTVVVNFWASWCPPCKAEMPHMQDFHEDNKGVKILAINITSQEQNQQTVKDFINNKGYTFPVLLEGESKLSKIYKAVTIPTTYIIDQNGVIKHRMVGPMSKEMLLQLTSDN
jgi:peroxiredoxin